MTDSLKSVPVNTAEAKYIIDSLNSKLAALNLREKLYGLDDEILEDKFQANNIKRKFEIMFQDELKNV